MASRLITDYNKLEKAKEVARVEWPVRIKFHYMTRITGRCRSCWIEGDHRITICSNLSVKEANETLWHELEHCRQYEEHPYSFEHIYDTQLEKVGLTAEQVNRVPPDTYKQIPYEKSARALEKMEQRLRPIKRDRR